MYRGQHGIPTDSERKDDVQEYFDDVIHEVSHKWDDLARKLGFKENRIKGIRSSEPDDDHRCREVLNRWRNREGRGATLQVLQQALIDIGETQTAENLNGTAAPPSGSGGHGSHPMSPASHKTVMYPRQGGSVPMTRQGPPCTVEDVINTLKDLYATEYAMVRPLPWCEDLNLPLGEVYTNLQYQRTDDRGHFEVTNTIVSLEGIYKNSKAEATNVSARPAVRRIRLEGDPGIGKSCSCQKLAHDWSSGKLDTFNVVFFLEMRHMSGKVKDEIFEQLLPEDTNMTPDQLWSYIQENQDDVLFILDGLDELSQTAREVTDVVDLIQGKILRNCHVLVTSRPYHCVEDLGKCHEFYKIVGYSENDSIQFIQKYFSDTPKSAKQLVDQLKREPNLSKIVVNPLNNVLICIVWEDNKGRLPSSPAELYEMIVYSVTKRYCSRKEIPLERDKIPSNIEDVLQCLGKLSWEGLQQDQLQFNIDDIKEKYGHNADDMLAIGLLTRDYSFSRIKRTCFCAFLHKTFQEYLTAHYISELVKKEGSRKEEKECLRGLFGMTEVKASNVDIELMSANRERYREVQNMLLAILSDRSCTLFETFSEELSKDGCQGEDRDILSFWCVMFLGKVGRFLTECRLADIVVPYLSQQLTNNLHKYKRVAHYPFREDNNHWIYGVKQVLRCHRKVAMRHDAMLIQHFTISINNIVESFEWPMDNMLEDLSEVQSLQHVKISIKAQGIHMAPHTISHYDSLLSNMLMRQCCLRSLSVKIGKWHRPEEPNGFYNLTATLQSVSEHATLEVVELEHPFGYSFVDSSADRCHKLVRFDIDAMVHKLTECLNKNNVLRILQLSWKFGKVNSLDDWFSSTTYKGICSSKALSDLCLAIQGNRTLETLTIDGMFSETEGHQEIIDQLIRNKPANFQELRIIMFKPEKYDQHISGDSPSLGSTTVSSSSIGQFGITVSGSRNGTENISTDNPSCSSDSISHEQRQVSPSTSTGASEQRYDLRSRSSSKRGDLGKRSLRSQSLATSIAWKKPKTMKVEKKNSQKRKRREPK